MTLRLLSTTGIPPPGLIERFHGPMRAVALTWLAVSRAVPVEITSWWRDPTRNAATGGAQWSQHLVGTAMDGRSPGMSRDKLLVLVKRAGARYGVSVPSAASESSGSSVHVQGLPVGAVRTILTREPQLIAQTFSFVGPPRPLA